jgi:hypothetical protein
MMKNVSRGPKAGIVYPATVASPNVRSPAMTKKHATPIKRQASRSRPS